MGNGEPTTGSMTVVVVLQTYPFMQSHLCLLCKENQAKYMVKETGFLDWEKRKAAEKRLYATMPFFQLEHNLSRNKIPWLKK